MSAPLPHPRTPRTSPVPHRRRPQVVLRKRGEHDARRHRDVEHDHLSRLGHAVKSRRGAEPAVGRRPAAAAASRVAKNDSTRATTRALGRAESGREHHGRARAVQHDGVVHDTHCC